MMDNNTHSTVRNDNVWNTWIYVIIVVLSAVISRSLYLYVNGLRDYESEWSLFDSGEEFIDDSIDGVYICRQSEWIGEITIIGDSWFGEERWSAGDTNYSNGIVKGNSLYDEYGYYELGRVEGNTLRMASGVGTMTYEKQ